MPLLLLRETGHPGCCGGVARVKRESPKEIFFRLGVSANCQLCCSPVGIGGGIVWIKPQGIFEGIERGFDIIAERFQITTPVPGVGAGMEFYELSARGQRQLRLTAA